MVTWITLMKEREREREREKGGGAKVAIYIREQTSNNLLFIN